MFCEMYRRCELVREAPSELRAGVLKKYSADLPQHIKRPGGQAIRHVSELMLMEKRCAEVFLLVSLVEILKETLFQTSTRDFI